MQHLYLSDASIPVAWLDRNRKVAPHSAKQSVSLARHPKPYILLKDSSQ